MILEGLPNSELMVRRQKDWGMIDRGWLKIFMGLSFGRYQVEGFKEGFGRLKSLNRFELGSGAGSARLERRHTVHLYFVESGGLNFVFDQEVVTVNAGEWFWLEASEAVHFREHNAYEDQVTVFYEYWLKPHQISEAPRWSQMAKSIDAFSLEFLVKDPHSMAKIQVLQEQRLWVQIVNGSISGDSTIFSKGDGIAIPPNGTLHFQAMAEGAELLIVSMLE